jgi:hypothetical protein
VAAQAQPRVFTASDFDSNIQGVNRPRLAVAPDGGFALAFEALVPRPGGSNPVWQVLVQRFAASGNPLGPTHYFEGESCAGDISIWLSDYVEHAELAFRPDGILLIALEHEGELQLGGDGVRSAETTLAAVDANGQLIDLNGAGNCVQKREIFVGGDRQDRPRLALTPNAAVLLTMDGFFDGSFIRNVAIRVLGNELEELITQVIPHDDPRSEQALHGVPDVATNGSLILSSWHECPIIDNQGNVTTCDIVAQFATATANGLQGVGGNQRVNVGDLAGTEQFNASAAMNAAGQSVIVWRDYRTGLQGDVFGQRFNAGGQPVGGNIQVSTSEGVLYYRPEVEMLDDGRFMVVWTDSSSAGFLGHGRRFNADGTPQGGPFVLVEGAGVESGLPSLAPAGATWQYAVLAEDVDDNILLVMNDATTIGVGVASDEAVPAAFALHQSYPNPFNPTTTIAYDLPRPAEVRLVVYDLFGREVKTLVHTRQAAGRYTGSFEAEGLASGTYFYRIEAGTWSQVRQFVLLK